jgi:prepilin-type N-terminal cleavage/methylation domain-containing protein
MAAEPNLKCLLAASHLSLAFKGTVEIGAVCSGFSRHCFPMAPLSLPSDRPVGSVRGFTLIEMAVVLVLIAIGLTFALRITVALRAGAQVADTRKAAENLRSAIIAYAVRNKRLPCPASGTTASSDANYGKELRDSNNLCTGRVNPTDLTVKGIIPWQTLGIGQDASLDGWFRRFTYEVSALAAEAGTSAAPNTLLVGTTGAIAVWDKDPAGGGTPAPRQINLEADNNNSGALFLLMSHGAGGSGAFVPSSTSTLPATADANAATLENINATPVYIQNESTTEILLYAGPREVAALLNAQSPTEFKQAEAVTLQRIETVMRALATNSGRLVIEASTVPAVNSVPASELGLSDEYKYDAWGNLFQYIVVAGYGNANFCTVTSPPVPSLTAPMLTVRSAGPNRMASDPDDLPASATTILGNNGGQLSLANLRAHIGC